MSTPMERAQVYASSQQQPKKTPARPRKLLPEQLKKLTRAAAFSGLVYRHEKDPILRSVTYDLQVKVAYGVRIPHDFDELFLLKQLNIDQLRQFCRHLGVSGMASAPKFYCRRALYAYFTKDPIDRSLMPFLFKPTPGSGNATRQSPPSVPSLTTTAMSPAVAINPSAMPRFLPQPFQDNGSSVVAASSMQPFQTFNTTTAGTFNATVSSNSNLQRFVPARIKKECPNATAPPSGNGMGSSRRGVEKSVQHAHSLIRIKRESLDHATMMMEPPSVPPLPSETPGPMESSEDNNSDRLVLTFLPETNDESSDAEVETSIHPWLLVNSHNNATHMVDEIEALVQQPVPTPTQTNNRDSSHPVDMETSVPEPFLSDKTHESPDRSEEDDSSTESPVMEVVHNGPSGLSDDESESPDDVEVVNRPSGLSEDDSESPDVEVVDHESPDLSDDDSASPDVEIVDNGSPDIFENTTTESPDLSANNSRSDRSVATHESPDMSDDNSSGSPDIETVDRSSEPTNVQEPNPQVPEEKACLESLEQQQQDLATETEEKGMFEYFKQNMDVVHDIRKEDLSLRKEDLELRRQDLVLKRKRNLQDAMNQTLQNYMNPACPPEVKDALLAQWRLMDADFKSI